MDLFGKYNSNVEFLKDAETFVENFEGKEIVLYGKGRFLPVLLKFADGLKIKYIVDSNEDLWGTEFKGYSVFSPEKLAEENKENTVVIITLYDAAKRAIQGKLIEMGYLWNNICTSYDFVTARNFLKHKKVVLPTLEFIINTACSLKCRYCIANIPYFKKNIAAFMSFEDTKKYLDNLFVSVDYIGMFQLSTGEVLLHPNFGKIMEYIFEKYRKKYEYLTFVTNGTIIPKEDLIETIAKCVDFIQVTPYTHKDTKKLLKTDDLRAIFDKHGINYFFSPFATKNDKWNDIGDLSVAKNRNDRDNTSLYKDCSMQACKCMVRDRLYPCTVACYAAHGGINEPSECQENIDFVKVSPDNSSEIIKYFLNATTLKFPQICDYCDGIGEYVNSKLIEAGEQL